MLVRVRWALRQTGFGVCWNLPAVYNKGVLPRHDGIANNGFTPGNQAPGHGPEGLVQPPPVLDLWKVDYAVGLHLDVIDLERPHQDIVLLLRYGLRRGAIEARGPVDLANGLLG